MKKIELTVYGFNELDEKAKKHARKLVREQIEGAGDDWYESVKTDAAFVGLSIDSFELYGQGQHISIDFNSSPEEVAQNILANHGVECESHAAALVFMEESEKNGQDDGSDEYMENHFVVVFRKALERYYFDMLEKAYDFSESDEYLADYCEGWGFTFLEDGKTLIPEQE